MEASASGVTPLTREERADIVLRAGAAYRAGKYAESADIRLEGIRRGMNFPEMYLHAAESLAMAGRAEEAFRMLSEAFDRGLRRSPDSLVKALELASLRNDPRWLGLLRRAEESTTVANPALRDELRSMARRGSDARAGRRLAEVPEPAQLEVVRATDIANTARLLEIVAAHGWPGRRLVGSDGAGDAALILQHADLDTQEKLAPVLRAAVDAGDASPSSLAYLTDRIRVQKGERQLYGTQAVVENGRLIPAPIEDAAGVDRRRKEVGLGTLEAYFEQLNAP